MKYQRLITLLLVFLVALVPLRATMADLVTDIESQSHSTGGGADTALVHDHNDNTHLLQESHDSCSQADAGCCGVCADFVLPGFRALVAHSDSAHYRRAMTNNAQFHAYPSYRPPRS